MSLTIFLFSVLVCTLSNAFLTPIVQVSSQRGISSRRLPSSRSLHQSDEEDESRRKLLVQTLFAAVTTRLVRSPIARAETLTSQDLAKITTTANRKIGGLSNKIRSIGNAMVG